MDPKACLISIAAALYEEDYGAAREGLAKYRQWRMNGGYCPSMPDGATGDEWAQRAERSLRSLPTQYGRTIHPRGMTVEVQSRHQEWTDRACADIENAEAMRRALGIIAARCRVGTTLDKLTPNFARELGELAMEALEQAKPVHAIKRPE